VMVPAFAAAALNPPVAAIAAAIAESTLRNGVENIAWPAFPVFVHRSGKSSDDGRVTAGATPAAGDAPETEAKCLSLHEADAAGADRQRMFPYTDRTAMPLLAGQNGCSRHVAASARRRTWRKLRLQNVGKPCVKPPRPRP
jgi:hypothetical protein